MSDRTAEIWSTRLQRELLALSESQTPTGDGDKESSKDQNEISMLPPFIKMTEYKMDIENGICRVNFEVQVDPPPATKEKTTNENQNSTDEKTDEGDSSPPTPSKDDEETPSASNPEKNTVTITLDASMETSKSGKPTASPNTYPFQKPLATLTAGHTNFPSLSSLRTGAPLPIDCDWTPSLHLSDAALNIALKIRESVKKQEALTTEPLMPLGGAADIAPVDVNEVAMGDVIDLNGAPFNMCVGMYSCKAIRRPEFVERAMKEVEERQKNSAGRGIMADATFLEEDDETPSGIGNYMRLQAGGIKKVAGAGIVGAGSILKSIVNSTKSVLEESFLMITDEHIIELRSNKFSIGTAVVVFINPIALLAKLKFRRQESISLFFKQAPDDPLIFMCPDSADAVAQIQNVLKRHGVKGKHTNAATQRSIQAALNIVVDIQAKERTLKDNPTVSHVDEIMSLYRQAAEKFENAGDARHEEVMSHMHKFLAKPMTTGILDGSYKGSSSAAGSSVPQGEVLDATTEQLYDDDDDETVKSSGTPIKPKKRDHRMTSDTLKMTDDILEEAKRDFDTYGIDDDDEEDDLDNFLDKKKEATAENAGTGEGVSDIDTVAELDAMLSAADKELNDLMKS